MCKLSPLSAWFIYFQLVQMHSRIARTENADRATDLSSSMDLGGLFCPEQCLPRLQTISIFSCSDVRCCLIIPKKCQQSAHLFRCNSLFFVQTRKNEVVGHIACDLVEFVRNVSTDSSYTKRETHFQIRMPSGSGTSPASDIVRSSFKPYLRIALVGRYSMNLTLLRYLVDGSHCQYG